MRVSGAATIDGRGLRGTTGVRVGLGALRSASWKAVFPSAPFPTFRRLDRLSKLACLASEAAGVAGLSATTRRETAQVLGTAWGCLGADLAFQASLTEGQDVKPALFPYTLPSTCLGELAVRHGLQGPTLCLSTRDLRGAVREALAILEGGEAQAVLLCLGDGWPLPETAAASSAPAFAAVLLEVADGVALCDAADLASAEAPLALLGELIWQAGPL